VLAWTEIRGIEDREAKEEVLDLVLRLEREARAPLDPEEQKA